ncbi:putative UPF0481 protein At3g02645 [Eucalyptus grandis]|uniref:putative UPF0481 protein At3g02645 n=1 Tax=Eucalyptus grandis TaxID=71139 RepID=UPI00192EF97B|nr:putative UPF0481 protein At3g02645 [Eucalyptus grandis]
MARLFNLLSSIPRKMKRSVKLLRKKPTSNASTELVNQHPHQQQPRDDQVPVPPQEPFVAFQNEVENNGGKVVSKDESGTPESKWVISIKENLEQACQDNEARSWPKLSIYKIPKYLRDGQDNAYVPRIVSLGPYHHNEPQVRQMERHKWRCLQRMLTRNSHKVGPYLDSMKEVEEKARGCYEGPIDMTSEKFVEMMILDGCFVIEIFQGYAKGFENLGYPPNDPIFSMRESILQIQRDMIMLENQIPLFILDQLLQLSEPDQKRCVPDLALEFFGPLKPTGDPQTKPSSNSQEFAQLPDHGRFHCLEVFRLSLLGSGPRPESMAQIRRLERPQQLIHSVTELREAGIRFKKSETGGLWDIKFEGGTLWIPQLLIHDGTRSLFLNLIAFEQSHIDCSNDITSYVIFMDHLINSAEDVRYLHKCGIIEPWLGSNAEVADLINRLYQEVVFDVHGSYLSKLCEEVNRHYQRRWNTWKAGLKHKYFSNPWSIFSFIAASVLLVLTLAQTFYAVYGYYRLGS